MAKGVEYAEEMVGWVSILVGFKLVQVKFFISRPHIFPWGGELVVGPEFGNVTPFIIYGDLLGYT